MYDPILDETYRLFVKGMGYLQANHIYKFKDYIFHSINRKLFLYTINLVVY